MKEIALYFTTAGLILFCILGIIQSVYHLKAKRQIKKLSEMHLYHLQEKFECEREKFEESLKRTMKFFIICFFVGSLWFGFAEIYSNVDQLTNQLWTVIEKLKTEINMHNIILISLGIIAAILINCGVLDFAFGVILEDDNIKMRSVVCLGAGTISLVLFGFITL